MTDAPNATTSFLPAIPIVTAGIGAWLGYWARGLEGRKAELLARIQDAVDEVRALQSVTAQYWSKDTASSADYASDLSQEAEIVGRLHMLNLMIEDMADYIRTDHVAALRSHLSDFRQAATGHEFAASDGHPAKPSAVSGCYQGGARLTMTLRRAGREYNRRLFSLGRRS